LVVLFGMPVIMILLFGFAIRNEVENAKVVVLDASQDQVTRELINKIEASNYFTVAGRIQWYNKIDALFRQGNIDEVIVFETNFARKLKRGEQPAIKIITDGSNPN